MGTIYKVLESLAIDHTFFYQFAIVVVLYLILRSLLFGKLQEVLDLREAKTTKMESGANEKIQMAEKLAQQYKDKIAQAKQEAFQIITKNKDEIISREAVKIKSHEEKVEAEIAVKRSEFEKEIESKKENIMKQAVSLSQELVNKIVQ